MFLQFIPLFLLLLLVFACFCFDCRFEPFKPKCMNKRMTYEAFLINEVSKRGPKHSTMTKLCQETQAKRSIKTQRSREARTGVPETIMTWPWQPPRAVVAATPLVAPTSPDFIVLLRGFSVFHAVFLHLCWKFIFKGDVFAFKGDIHLIHSQFSIIFYFRVRLDQREKRET